MIIIIIIIIINTNYKILLTIKFLSKKLSSESTIYNSFRLKKHLILILKTHFNSKKLFELKNNLFQLKKTITSIFKKNYLLKYPKRNLSHNNNINNNS